MNPEPMRNQTSFQRILAFIVIGIGLIAVGVAAMALLTMRQTQVGREISAIPAKVNYAAPSLTLNDLEGKPHSLNDYPGQVVLVNLWATWCPPCLEEMPVFEGFYRDYSTNGFLIIAINDGDPLSDVQEFVENYGLTFPIWSDPEYSTEQTFETMNLPSSYVIDRQGRVRLRWVGAISRAMLEKYVLPIIEEK
jgi:cytochrome c biogenesis protein CcmG/thiol:disulfide interchange protein DsbE